MECRQCVHRSAQGVRLGVLDVELYEVHTRQVQLFHCVVDRGGGGR